MAAKFTKANFEAIADVFGEAHNGEKTPSGKDLDRDTLLHVEGKLARLFAAVNPRFDKLKFYGRIDKTRRDI